MSLSQVLPKGKLLANVDVKKVGQVLPKGKANVDDGEVSIFLFDNCRA